jgi:hypothetical protein
MSLSKLTKDIAYHQKQVDEPNDVGGLTADGLKAIFDKAALDIKDFLNLNLIEELEELFNILKGAGWTNESLKGLKDALEAHKDSADHDERYYTENEVNMLLSAYATINDITNNRKLDANGNFTGSWFGITSPAYAEPGIAAVVQSHTEQLATKAQQTDLIATQNELTYKSTELNGRIDTIVATPVSGVSQEEILDARSGKTSLGEKVRTIDSTLDYLVSDYNYINDITLNNGNAFIPKSKSYLKIKSLTNDKTTDGVPDALNGVILQSAIGNSLNLPTLLQGESIDENYIYRAWRKLNFNELTFVYFQMENTNTYYRLKATVPDNANLSVVSSVINILSSSGSFVATSQVNSATAANIIWIASTDKAINIKINKAEFDTWNAANGGNKTIGDYVQSLPNFVLYARLITKVQEAHKIIFNAYKWNEVTFTPSNVKCTLKLYAKENELIDNNYVRYEAKIKNPLSTTTYTNDLVQLYASFKKSECKNDKCIVVTDLNGTVYPHQWEDDRTASFKYDKNIGKYNDGSLKNGTLWIKDTIDAGAEKTYYIDVYENEISNYSANISDAYANDILTISTTDVALKFEKARKMTLSNVAYKGVNKYGSSTDIVTLRYADSLSTFRTVYSYGTLVNYKINGNGVLFKEFEGIWDIDNKFRFTLKIKLFVNNEISIQYYAKALNALATTDCYGTSVQLAYPITTVTTDRHFYDIGVLPSKMTCIDWLEDSKTMATVAYYTHGDIPRDDNTRPTYPVSLITAISSDKAIVAVGWLYGGSDTLYAIEKDEVFSGKIILDIGGYTDTTNEETNRLFNQLCGRITKEPIILNERKLFNNLLDWIQHVDYNFVETYAPNQLMYPYMSKYILYKYKGIGSFADIITYFKGTVDAYFGGGTQAGLINAYNTTTSAGYQITSRIIPMAKHYRDECIRLGDTTNQTYMETLLKAWAELSCQLIESKGFTPLIYTDTTGNSNSVASGLKALSMGLDLDPSNTRWQNAYNTNLNYFNTMISATNIIQENGTTKLQKGHYLHYSAYAMFDYLQATKHTNTLKPLTYIYEATTPTGVTKEQEYCISASRRGLGHTNAYAIYGLCKDRTPYNIEHANKILENVINQAVPNGGHKFPLENWRLETASNYQSSAPFEIQAYGETIIMLDTRI